MTEVLVFLLLAGAIGGVGVVIGMIVAGRIDRRLASADEPPEAGEATRVADAGPAATDTDTDAAALPAGWAHEEEQS